MLIVYFSSATENTKRFVEKLGLPAKRIPLRRSDPPLRVDEPYVLISPTYGGGATLTHTNSRPVPNQVIRFLNDPRNRGLIRGVVAAGNTNFGPDFCRAGDVISGKCQVPYLYRFELMGSPDDVTRVRTQLTSQAESLGLVPSPAHDSVAPGMSTPFTHAAGSGAASAADTAEADEAAQRLARLRAKYERKRASRRHVGQVGQVGSTSPASPANSSSAPAC